MSFCSCVGVFLRAFYFLERKHGGMCSPKIGEPSLATVGYEHKLWGKNISKRLASVNCKL